MNVDQLESQILITSQLESWKRTTRVCQVSVLIIGVLSIVTFALSISALNRYQTKLRPRNRIRVISSSEVSPPTDRNSTATKRSPTPTQTCSRSQSNSDDLAVKQLNFQMEEVGSMSVTLKTELENVQKQLLSLRQIHLPGIVLFSFREKPMDFRSILGELSNFKADSVNLRVTFEFIFSHSIESLNWTVLDLTATEARKLEVWSMDRKQVTVTWEYPMQILPEALSRRFTVNLKGPTRVEEFEGCMWELGSSTRGYSSYHQLEIFKRPWYIPTDVANLSTELQSIQNLADPNLMPLVIYIADRNEDSCVYYEQLACLLPEFRKFHQELFVVKIERNQVPREWELVNLETPIWYSASHSPSEGVQLEGVYTGELVEYFKSRLSEWNNPPESIYDLKELVQNQ